MTKRFNSRRSKRVKAIRSRKHKARDYSAYGAGQSPFNGGLVNPISGAGTDLDKNAFSFFSPTRVFSKNTYETMYVESWAAGKFVDIPIDDMFIRWREFTDMEEKTKKLVQKAEKEFLLRDKLSRSMKAARLYGTGLMIFITKEAKPERPLNISRMLPGDLLNILTVDRFDANVIGKNNNVFSKNYGKPEFYTINLRSAGSITVHHSRVIRFDGIKSTSDNSWDSYDDDWGVAPIIPVLTEIFQESNTSKGVSHLVNEASIPVQKVEGLEDILAGTGDEMNLAERMAELTMLRSIYRTVFMDAEDSFERHDVTFSGLPDVLDRNAIRLAAAANIPVTRFWGKSAVGLNATGEGDERNYALQVNSDQENKLRDPFDFTDRILIRHLGLTEPIEYRFPSILDMSDGDKADVLTKKSQAISSLVQSGTITEDEARKALDGDDIIGDLEDLEVYLSVDPSVLSSSVAHENQTQDSKKWRWPWQRK